MNSQDVATVERERGITITTTEWYGNPTHPHYLSSLTKAMLIKYSRQTVNRTHCLLA
jgi:hypothetical protein